MTTRGEKTAEVELQRKKGPAYVFSLLKKIENIQKHC